MTAAQHEFNYSETSSRFQYCVTGCQIRFREIMAVPPQRLLLQIVHFIDIDVEKFDNHLFTSQIIHLTINNI